MVVEGDWTVLENEDHASKVEVVLYVKRCLAFFNHHNILVF